jgi:hypothetical protein
VLEFLRLNFRALVASLLLLFYAIMGSGDSGFHPILWLYSWLQFFIDKILSPDPPAPNAHLRQPRIAIIGAGLTGVFAASHCVGHGFDVVLFEAGGRDSLGGIWSV